MTSDRRLEDSISSWLRETAPRHLPAHVLDATFESTRQRRQEVGWHALLGSRRMPHSVAAIGVAAAIVIGVVLAIDLGVVRGPTAGPSPSSTTTPTVTPSSSSRAPLARPMRCGALPSAEPATVLGCSRDGAILLVQKADENLYVRRADGSETLVTGQFPGITGAAGSRYPQGATISPDGSRVVFAGVTKPADQQVNCHDGALFAVDANGGPAEVLWRSHVPQNGIVMYPTFSPDGTQIAFADGYCDQDHGVWVMNADGSDAHQIFTAPWAGHVYGVAWSPAGDRIALDYVGGEGLQSGHMFAFGIDGSDLTDGADASGYCWPGTTCPVDAGTVAP